MYSFPIDRIYCTIQYRTFTKKRPMETQIGKNERIEIRVSSYDKKIFQKAQKLSGDKSFSSFITRIVKEKAEEIVAKNERIIASEKDRQIFFNAVLVIMNQIKISSKQQKGIKTKLRFSENSIIR